MKKLIISFFLLIFLSFFSIILVLSTIGIETDRFNNFIVSKINQNDNNINLKLEKIYFKLDFKELSLFLETFNPNVLYRNTSIPTKNIKVYIDFLSIIKSETKIKKIKFVFQKINVHQIKKLSSIIKPSNFNSFVNNNISDLLLEAETEIYFKDNNLLENFIARGSVSNLKTQILDNLEIKNGKFKFFADNTDILIKSFFGNSDYFKIEDGDLKLQINEEISLQSNFKSSLKINNEPQPISNILKNFQYTKFITKIDSELQNSLSINFDKTYKVKNYDFNSNGKIFDAHFNLKEKFGDNIFDNKIKEISLKNAKIETNFNLKKKDINLSGKYSLDESNFKQFNLKNSLNDQSLNLTLDADFDQLIDFKIINYVKSKNKISKIFLDLEKDKNELKINKFSLKEEKNVILLNGLKSKKGKFLSFDELLIKTYKNDEPNNDFSIKFDKNIKIVGKYVDASNLPKILSNQSKNAKFSNINTKVEIDVENIIAPLSEKLINFKLIGTIKKGKFTKISSKGDFGEGNFLDISMKSDNKNEKKYLEIYSDLTKPLLTEYKFFKGITGGKLLYSSIIGKEVSNSKLKIEEFKVVNAPGFVKLLSLADLGGLADLAEGEGISFEILEINFEKKEGLLKINEILAIGPSISVLMEGYQNQQETSLRGTLVPAKGLNKIISRIPLIGDIVVPKEVGEGVFGISFKIKGPSGRTKTTINPIRTITPRFIQKILEKKISK